MSDYRFDHTAPLHAVKRGLMGAGDHPLHNGILASVLGGKIMKPMQPKGEMTPPAGIRAKPIRKRRSRKER